MHQLLLLKSGTRKNITQLVGGLSWSSNVDALGVELAFEYATNDSKPFEGMDIIEAGDQLMLANGGQPLHYFVVVKIGSTGRFGKSITCFDRAWYLNKNETIIQFRRVSATQAIQKLLDRFGVKHRIATMPTLITHIYKDEVVSDILLDILQQVEQETGKRYRMEMQRDELVIASESDLLITPQTALSGNTATFPLAETVSNPSREISIEEMKNKVVVVADGEESLKVYAERQNDASIARYGLLTEVVTVDQKNAAQARQIASTTLKSLNRTGEAISCEMLGHDDVRAGRIMDIKQPAAGIVGRFRIRSANHTVANGIHRVAVELEAI